MPDVKEVLDELEVVLTDWIEQAETVPAKTPEEKRAKMKAIAFLKRKRKELFAFAKATFDEFDKVISPIQEMAFEDYVESKYREVGA